jgi:UDP-glucose:(heptosyl)LPS alpha-1,3-glucosyltransferase
MRIVLLKSGLSRQGGLEKYAHRTARAFEQSGCNVTVLTTGQAQIDFPATVINCPLSSTFSYKKIRQFDDFCSDYLKKKPAELIFGMDRNRFQTHIRAGNGVHASYLDYRKRTDGWLKSCSFQFNPLHRTILNIEKQSFEHPNLRALFANSYMVRRQILTHYKVDSKKIHVLHNGVEWAELNRPFSAWHSDRKQIAASLQLDPNQFHFLFIGHNFERKGLQPLLEALASLKDPHAHLSVVGYDKNSAYFEQLAQKLQIGKQIKFFGKMADTTPFYQLADCLVIPSLYDPCANVTVEALAMGVYVVSSKLNGGYELLTPQNGIAIDSILDLDSFKAALKTEMSRPKTPLSSKTIRDSVKHLDFSIQLKRLVQLCLS